LGQTKDQVTAAFGQPLKVASLGGKVIFYYKDMKVTFSSGKVSDVE
jgi:outer membrane protein assembly factor BamE (lipoprotein component of BamABCDE complex)